MILSQDIRSKKELKGIDESLIIEKLKDYFSRNKDVSAALSQYSNEKQLRKNSDYRKILKKIRQELHESYGMFQIPGNAEEIKQEFLRKLKVNQAKEEDYEKILSLHVSTKERIQSYPIIYQKIFERTGRAKVILDLGCGLNPVSVYYMNIKNFEYIASDIDKSNLGFIDRFFQASRANGRTIVIDLMKESEKLKEIECDVCFLFKVLEIDKRIAEPIFNSIKAKFIVASFSTLSISGRIMSHSEREWFEKMLSRLHLSFSAFRTENEIFYVIKKL